MKLEIKDILYFSIIAILIALFSFHSCNQSQKLDQQSADFKEASDFSRKRDSFNLQKIDQQANQIVVISQNILSEKNAKELLAKELKGYKSVKSYTEMKIKEGFNHRGIALNVSNDTLDFLSLGFAIEDCLPVDTVRKHFVKVGRKYGFNDNWANIYGSIGKDSLNIDSMFFSDEIDVTIGTKGEGFFGNIKKPVVEAKSYSPYSTIVYVNDIVVEDKRTTAEKIFLSKPAMFIYGLAAGFITNQITPIK